MGLAGTTTPDEDNPGSRAYNRLTCSPQNKVNMHMPERWGYLQFSTARPGTVAFRPDPAAPARRALHMIYDAQAADRKQQGRWARDPKQLGLANRRGADFGPPHLETTSTRWQASVERRISEGKTER